ncbi:MAG: lysine--tRNA ligase, partial [Candidatus Latescibacteria bacterium]|nr:lysine--tRNA ligase [Candidatus Latescibacterota bacterium]
MNQEHHAQDEKTFRLEKLTKIKSETGLPYRFDRTHTNIEIINNFDELSNTKQIVKVAGRLIAKREHGKTKFGHLQDQTEKIQVYFRKDFLADAFDKLDLVDIGDLLGIEGEVFKTHTNEI